MRGKVVLHVVLAFVTSRRPPDLDETDLVIEEGSPGFEETGLKVTSVVRLHRLLTVGAPLIVRELGRLAPAQQEAINDRLRRLFGL
jgi:mRNA interferase MazF